MALPEDSQLGESKEPAELLNNSTGPDGEKETSCCFQAWVYPELPWGAPPSWNRKGRLGGTFLVYWELLTCFACVYVAITVPYIAGIDEAKGVHSIFEDCILFRIRYVLDGEWHGWIGLMDVFCDSLFVIDLILNFHTARWEICTDGREHWHLIQDLPTIRSMYMWSTDSDGNRTWWPGAFYIDVLGVIPWQHVDCMGLDSKLKYLRVLRLIKLTRMYRIRRLIEGLRYKFPTSIFAITSLELILTMFLAAHWLCCIWFRIGMGSLKGWVYSPNANLMDEGGNPLEEGQEVYEWVTALYWAITTMTTIGYGDISATTNDERAIACVVMILGCGFFAWSTGTITSVLTTKPACKVRFSDKLEELAEFMNSRALSPELRSAIRSFYMLKFPTMKIFDEEHILSDMPLGLANQVRFELYRDIVRKCPLFQTMDEATHKVICMRLVSQYKTEGIQLTAEGEYPDAMYIVRFGTVEVKVQGETVLTAETGDLFGENALLGLTSDGKRNRSSFAKTMCEICALRKEDLWDLLKIESFRRPFSTLVHQHISRLDSSTLVSNVSKASRYCVNWGQLTKQRSIRNMLQREKEQAQIVRKESLERAKGPGSSKYMAQTELNSILRTQLTLLVESIRIKSSEIKEVHNQIHAVLAFSWRGEQRGQLWVPTLSWSEPFLLMLPNPREGAEDDYLHVPLQKVQIITLTHYTADWKTLPPLVIKLFQVTMDSIHFIAPVSMPENQSPMENHLFESSAGLRYLAGKKKISAVTLTTAIRETEEEAGTVYNLSTDTRYTSPTSIPWPESALIMHISVHRLLPPESLWRRTIDVLKRRGASRFFIKRQRQAIADMRINFDKIIEDVMTDSSLRHGAQKAMDAAIREQMGAVQSLSSNVDRLHQRMMSIESKFSQQEKVLQELAEMTREVVDKVKCDRNVPTIFKSHTDDDVERAEATKLRGVRGEPVTASATPTHQRAPRTSGAKHPEANRHSLPASADSPARHESVAAILERRSLLLSPHSAWNALVKAETAQLHEPKRHSSFKRVQSPDAKSGVTSQSPARNQEASNDKTSSSADALSSQSVSNQGTVTFANVADPSEIEIALKPTSLREQV